MRNSRRGQVSSLDKAIGLLFTFARRGPLGIREIAEPLRIPPSTAYRLVQVLRRHGLVRQDPLSQKYALGLRLLELAEPLARQLDVWRIAGPHLLPLAERHQETVQLTVRHEDRAVTVEVVESREPLRYAPPRGASVPLHCGAQGKAILAFLPKPDRDAYLRSPLQRFTPHTITSPRTLARELARIRESGFARSVEELYLGATGVAAPILDRFGAVAGSCGVSGPLLRLPEGRMQAITLDVLACARKISAELGGTVPPSPDRAHARLHPITRPRNTHARRGRRAEGLS